MLKDAALKLDRLQETDERAARRIISLEK